MNLEQLRSLNENEQVAFAALTCERLLPLYQAFANACNCGDPDAFRGHIATLYAFGLGVREDQQTYQRQLAEVEQLVPDLDDFTVTVASFGFDAALCLHAAIRFLVEQEGSCIAAVSSGAFDTVDMYVQLVDDLDPADPALELKIARSPWMVQEVERQRSLCSTLLALGASEESIRQLRALNAKAPIVDLSALRSL